MRKVDKYSVVPVPKPRMTQRDKWAKRPAVLRYRAFCDEIRLIMKPDVLEGWLTFHMPMPKSWSQKKQAAMEFQPHKQKPDIDNLIKALFDALLDDDSSISEVHARKVWARSGAIEISIWE